MPLRLARREATARSPRRWIPAPTPSPAPAATGGRRDRRRPDPQALAQLGQKAHLRRRRRGQADRPGLLCTVQGAQAVDADAAGDRGGGAEHRGSRQRQHDRPDARKNTLKPHLQKQWVIPPEANAAFAAGMEDVLEVYQRPHDPARPLVCLDEATKQLIKQTRVPVPAKPGQPARHNYEYERNSLPRAGRGHRQPVHAVRTAGRLAPHQRPAPAKALGDSHFSFQHHFELSATMDWVELLHAPPHGDRPRRLVYIYIYISPPQPKSAVVKTYPILTIRVRLLGPVIN